MKIFIVVFSLFSSFLLAQEVKFSKDFKVSNYDISKKIFENSEVNVYYKFTSIDKESSDFKTNESICILQMGPNFSKFVDIEKLKVDSLYQTFSKQGYAGTKEINLLLKHKPLWGGIIIKKSKNDSLVRQNLVVGKICQYEEILPHLEWQLKNETKEILGYQCKKATVTYRGRLYIAWYASELPFNNGPYIFRGLPGLILEVEDTDQYIHFKAEGIDKNAMLIYLDNSGSVLKSTREKCRKLQENYFYNPSSFTQGKAYNEDGSVFIPKPTDSKYNPVELE